ncbi:hypothetical protein E2P81_ATG01987 [Venturia nashicola]|uniref:Uncharacterized protein n=1 Tax=Venturia nashicola TaxID=86259 RepID=A0A4Z1PLC8_9PEZI|nr:hypothetical protein E6O75_ATG02028 [Venturia nashicola]TLD35684.1 hypothetical protein E2P81_ATG01987 [Venturia nashicola]
MKLALLTLAACALTVTASNCEDNFNWCGWDLLKRGDYRDYIKAALTDAKKPITEHNVNNSLFKCANNGKGDASFLKICEGTCEYGGSGKSNDFCS